MNEKVGPKHIAIIMDGNRRWARAQGIDSKLGHKKGAETLEEIAKYCNKIGIEALTVYAFSTENWKRTKEEVSAIILLLQMYLDKFLKKTDLDNIKVRIIGDREKNMPPELVIENGELKSEDISEDLIEKNLYTHGISDPDLIIRTSGEIRTSNFLPWQGVYAEYLFLNKYWPEFTSEDIDFAIEEYSKRQRRVGK